MAKVHELFYLDEIGVDVESLTYSFIGNLELNPKFVGSFTIRPKTNTFFLIDSERMSQKLKAVVDLCLDKKCRIFEGYIRIKIISKEDADYPLFECSFESVK